MPGLKDHNAASRVCPEAGELHGPLYPFAAAQRCSELVGLKVSVITATFDSMEIRLGRSKTGQEGQGSSIGLPRGVHRRSYPVRAFRESS